MPVGSLRRSQRHSESTIGSTPRRGGGPSLMTSAGAIQLDARGSPRTTSMPRASSPTKRGGSDRFFVAVGSIAGAMQCVSNPSSSAGTKLGRVNTTASAPCSSGSRILPGALHPDVRGVRADVAAPDHHRAQLFQRCHQWRGLWILEQDDVAGRHLTGQRVRVPSADAIEERQLRGAEVAAVASTARAASCAAAWSRGRTVAFPG